MEAEMGFLMAGQALVRVQLTTFSGALTLTRAARTWQDHVRPFRWNWIPLVCRRTLGRVRLWFRYRRTSNEGQK